MPLNLTKLNALITSDGRTKTAIAGASGMARENLANILNGKRHNLSIKTLDALATALHVNSADLLVHTAPRP